MKLLVLHTLVLAVVFVCFLALVMFGAGAWCESSGFIVAWVPLPLRDVGWRNLFACVSPESPETFRTHVHPDTTCAAADARSAAYDARSTAYDVAFADGTKACVESPALELYTDAFVRPIHSHFKLLRLVGIGLSLLLFPHSCFVFWRLEREQEKKDELRKPLLSPENDV